MRFAEITVSHGGKRLTLGYTFCALHGVPANVRLDQHAIESIEDLCAEDAERRIDAGAAELEDAHDAAREVMLEESRIMAERDRAERGRR